MVVAVCVVVAGCVDEPEPPVLPGQASPTCGGEVRGYLVDRLIVPTSSSDAEELGFDLDSDGTSDNVLGNAASALQPLPLQANTDAAIAGDTLVLALSVELCANGESRVTVLPGARVDRDRAPPRVHLHGLPVVPAVGTAELDGRTYALATEGSAWVPVSSMVDLPGTPPSWIHAFAVTASVELGADDLEGRLAFAPTNAELMRTITPAVVRSAAALIVGQPGCPLSCEDEALATMMRVLDADEDGEITEDEFGANSLIQTLLRDDLDLLRDEDVDEPIYWPGYDREEDSISVGLGIHAITAELVTE